MTPKILLAIALAAYGPISLRLTGVDLTRLHVGNQAGILKVYAGDHHSVRFSKSSSTSDVSAIDGEKWAPVAPADRDQILGALGVRDVHRLDHAIISGFSRLPQLEATALLGVLATHGQESPPLSPHEQAATVHFLEHLVSTDGVPKVRRQAVLALAIQPATDPAEVKSVIGLLEHDHNAWDTFTTVQFFDYHRAEILLMPELEAVRKQVQRSDNPHADQIVQLLQPSP